LAYYFYKLRINELKSYKHLVARVQDAYTIGIKTQVKHQKSALK